MVHAIDIALPHCLSLQAQTAQTPQSAHSENLCYQTASFEIEAAANLCSPLTDSLSAWSCGAWEIHGGAHSYDAVLQDLTLYVCTAHCTQFFRQSRLYGKVYHIHCDCIQMMMLIW